MYVPSFGGIIIPAPIQELTWEGNAFRFNTAIVAGPGAGFYTVTGTLAADGSVGGEMRRRGNTLPPSYTFTGVSNK